MNAGAGVAELLSELHGVPISQVSGGLRVKETETAWVDVMRMIYNWRVVRVLKDSPETVDRAWCYYGTDIATLLRAVEAAIAWDGGDGTAPAGWDKDARTGEYSRERAIA